MKKVLVVLLILTMAGGAFAQVKASISGSAALDFGASIDFSDSDATSWMFRPDDAKIGVTGVAGPVSAGVTLQASSGTAELYNWFAAVGSKSVEFKVGYDLLPWIQWSSIDFMGDNNWCVGASAVKDTFINLKFGKGDVSVYGGLMAAGVDDKVMKDYAVFPGFYLGGDFGKEKLSVGAAFAGVPRGKDWIKGDEKDDEGRFAWTGDLHFKVNADPLSLGINVAMYGDPSVVDDSWWTPNCTPFYGLVTGKREDFILEGMIDIGISLSPCNIGIAVGLVANLADKDKYNGGAAGLQFGADAAFELGGGFSFIPGVIIIVPLRDAGDKAPNAKGSMNIGATLGYSF